MKSSRKARRLAHCARASSLCALLAADAALAAQGPGSGHGTATAFVQLTVTLLVYGAALLAIGVGLIGALRQR
jgi:hypothetical protein